MLNLKCDLIFNANSIIHQILIKDVLETIACNGSYGENIMERIVVFKEKKNGRTFQKRLVN